MISTGTYKRYKRARSCVKFENQTPGGWGWGSSPIWVGRGRSLSSQGYKSRFQVILSVHDKTPLFLAVKVSLECTRKIMIKTLLFRFLGSIPAGLSSPVHPSRLLSWTAADNRAYNKALIALRSFKGFIQIFCDLSTWDQALLLTDKFMYWVVFDTHCFLLRIVGTHLLKENTQLLNSLLENPTLTEITKSQPIRQCVGFSQSLSNRRWYGSPVSGNGGQVCCHQLMDLRNHYIEWFLKGAHSLYRTTSTLKETWK